MTPEEEIRTIQAEIERLQKLLYDKCDKYIARNRAEAIKDFAKKLKEERIDVDVSYGYGREYYTEVVTTIEIDNIVKEMVGNG